MKKVVFIDVSVYPSGYYSIFPVARGYKENDVFYLEWLPVEDVEVCWRCGDEVYHDFCPCRQEVTINGAKYARQAGRARRYLEKFICFSGGIYIINEQMPPEALKEAIETGERLLSSF